MKPEEWWKNFALGLEVDVSGTFIYNGVKRLDELDNLSNSSDIFEVLYNLSVGIERLLKVAIVLIEHNSQLDMQKFEQSLISHNVMELANRVDAAQSLELSGIHRELLSLLSKFYKTHRYNRFSIRSVPNIKAEQVFFLEYLKKYLGIEFPHSESFFPIKNSDQIRKFIGRAVQKIAHSVFKVVKEKANALNIYTDELRGDSKAIQVFYGKRLDFIDERIKKKEILLFLMHATNRGTHIDLLRSLKPLELNPEMASSYIKALLSDSNLPFVGDEIDELYADAENVVERIGFLEIMDNEYLSYGEGDES